jgi:Ca2+-transporting ATPase
MSEVIQGVSNDSSLFKISSDELVPLHDPKSIKYFKERFNDNPDLFFDALNSSSVNGLDASLTDYDQRKEQFGLNVLPVKKPKSFFRLAWEALHDKVLILLSCAAVISLALGLYETFGQEPEYDELGNALPAVDWVEGVSIMVAVLIVVLVGAANDFQKELQFAKLNAKKNDRDIVVIRSGKETVISIFDLLVGDILTLQTGDILPGDAVLIQGSCECDESALTGETQSIQKVEIRSALRTYDEKYPKGDADIGTKGVPDSFLISDSRIISGLGRATVTAVGTNSVHGRTMQSLKVETQETPLQVRLNALADGITKYGILVAVLLLLVLTFKFVAKLPPGKEYSFLPSSKRGSKFLDIVITAITIIVVAIPEGLPLAVTLALAFATTRMAKDDNLVRVLKACEIMGGATAVCSDKTGTLTENTMKVVSGFIAGVEFDDNNDKLKPELEHSNDINFKEDIKLDILRNIALNSTAFENDEALKKEVDENPTVIPLIKKHFWESKLSKRNFSDMKEPEHFIGSKTETALLELATRSFGLVGSELSTLRSNPTLLKLESVAQVVPFESSRKWGGLVVKLSDGLFRFYIKGAGELVLEGCDYTVLESGETAKLTKEAKNELNDTVTSFAELALRTISLAHKDFHVAEWPPVALQNPKRPEEAKPSLLFESNEESEGLILDGIFGIKDPLRPGVKEAVAQCKRAGVTVRMITGDNLVTAKAISLNCGILSPDDDMSVACLEGPVFRKMSRKDRYEAVRNIKTLARSSPEDKRALVEILKQQGEVVAVTGDGTNDAPALKLADVGFSMGISGTEVAREASDIILMTDDFSAIVNAIKWGRCVSSSIKKFIQFQLTVNVTAVVLTFVTAVASSEGESVLTAVQLLWVNLIMDTLAALALATDKPDDSSLDKTPEGRSTTLISVSMWKMILGQSSLQLVVTFILHFCGPSIFFKGKQLTHHDKAQMDALTFNTFVWLQFFKLWVTRKLDEADGISNVKDRITANNLNFFQHLFRNWYFLGIATIIAGFQILIMFVGGTAFSVVRLTGPMWAVSLICGMLSLPWGAFIRIIPDEWVIRIFPTRAYKALTYILSFKYLKRGKSRYKYTVNHENDEEKTILYEKYPIFKKTKEGLLYAKDHNDEWEEETEQSSSYNPFRRWKKSKRDSLDEESTIENNGKYHHTIAALTLVPTVVGGAVGGWSPLGQGSRKED